jgi:hypothetical protein
MRRATTTSFAFDPIRPCRNFSNRHRRPDQRIESGGRLERPGLNDGRAAFLHANLKNVTPQRIAAFRVTASRENTLQNRWKSGEGRGGWTRSVAVERKKTTPASRRVGLSKPKKQQTLENRYVQHPAFDRLCVRDRCGSSERRERQRLPLLPTVLSARVQQAGLLPPRADLPACVRAAGLHASRLRTPGLHAAGLRDPGLHASGLRQADLLCSRVREAGLRRAGLPPGVCRAGLPHGVRTTRLPHGVPPSLLPLVGRSSTV